MIYFVFIAGLIFGSFLNVVIYRLNPALKLKGGIFGGRSFCPECKHQLKWYDLVPILSFFLLKGRCRYCNRKISWQYPIVEILSGLIWFGIFYKSFGFSDLGFVWDLGFGIWNLFWIFDAIYYIFIFSSLLVIAIYDYNWQIIPDKIVFPAIAIALIYNFFKSLNFEIFKSPNIEFFKYLNVEIFLYTIFVATAAFLFFFSIFYFSRGRAMGFGDAKLAILIGLFLSPLFSAIAFTLSFTIGAVFGIILLIFTDKTWKSKIAFGPFLVIGTAISFFFSNFIINQIF